MNRLLFRRLLVCSALLVSGCSSAPRDVVGVPCDESSGLFISPGLLQREEWYGQHLSAAHERNLCQEAGGVAEIYRFTWLRTFHPPVIVRIQRDSSGYSGHATRLTGAGGYEPGEIDISVDFSVSREDWRQLHIRLEEVEFWSVATPEMDDNIGLDGAQWIIEGTRAGVYRALDRWSPENGTPVRNLGEHFLAVAQLRPPSASEVY